MVSEMAEHAHGIRVRAMAGLADTLNQATERVVGESQRGLIGRMVKALDRRTVKDGGEVLAGINVPNVTEQEIFGPENRDGPMVLMDMMQYEIRDHAAEIEQRAGVNGWSDELLTEAVELREVARIGEWREFYEPVMRKYLNDRRVINVARMREAGRIAAENLSEGRPDSQSIRESLKYTLNQQIGLADEVPDDLGADQSAMYLRNGLMLRRICEEIANDTGKYAPVVVENIEDGLLGLRGWERNLMKAWVLEQYAHKNLEVEEADMVTTRAMGIGQRRFMDQVIAAEEGRDLIAEARVVNNRQELLVNLMTSLGTDNMAEIEKAVRELYRGFGIRVAEEFPDGINTFGDTLERNVEEFVKKLDDAEVVQGIVDQRNGPLVMNIFAMDDKGKNVSLKIMFTAFNGWAGEVVVMPNTRPNMTGTADEILAQQTMLGTVRSSGGDNQKFYDEFTRSIGGDPRTDDNQKDPVPIGVVHNGSGGWAYYQTAMWGRIPVTDGVNYPIDYDMSARSIKLAAGE